jgi:D-tyrosyl-tRNA(Tyr) deacylase
MRAIVQRVSRAAVQIEGRRAAGIGRGFVVLLGIGRSDDEADADFLLDRILGLRVFADAGGKMNLALGAIEGELLVISQFTLYADTSQRRPSFTAAAPPEDARRLYDYFRSQAGKRDVRVESGEFGAHMEVDLINDGPVTIILDSAVR